MVLDPTIIEKTASSYPDTSYQYPANVAQFELVKNLLTSVTLTWFTSLLDKGHSLLEDFNGFIRNFKANLEVIATMTMMTNKIGKL